MIAGAAAFGIACTAGSARECTWRGHRGDHVLPDGGIGRGPLGCRILQAQGHLEALLLPQGGRTTHPVYEPPGRTVVSE